jgi:T5orf172 domain
LAKFHGSLESKTLPLSNFFSTTTPSFAVPQSYSVKYSDLQITAFSRAQVKCIAFAEDGSRCNTSLLREKVEEAFSLIKLFPTTMDDFERLIPLVLCDSHNVLHIRSGYIQKWSEAYNIGYVKGVFGAQYLNTTTFNFTPPPSTLQAGGRTEKVRKVRSVHSIIEECKSLGLSNEISPDTLPKSNASQSQIGASDITGIQRTHLAPQFSLSILRSQSIGDLRSQSHTSIAKLTGKDIQSENENRGQTETTAKGKEPHSDNFTSSPEVEPIDSANATEDNNSDVASMHVQSPKGKAKGDSNPRITYYGKLNNLMRAHIPTGSYVYVFSATLDSNPIVKIGHTENLVEREKEIKKCKQFTDIKLKFHVVVAYRKRVEALAQMELSEFQQLVECQCTNKKKGPSKKHREWFTVHPDVARNAVERWTDFVEHAYDSNGSIEGTWSTSVKKFLDEARNSDSAEIAALDRGDLETHHKLRHLRYKEWIRKTKQEHN